MPRDLPDAAVQTRKQIGGEDSEGIENAVRYLCKWAYFCWTKLPGRMLFQMLASPETFDMSGFI